MLAFAQAPFSHSHDSDPHHEHGDGIAHAHWEGSVPDGSAFEAPDSDARSTDWFACEGKSPNRLIAAPPETVQLPEPTVQPRLVAELTPRNHDPPWQFALKSRAPPA